MFTRGRSTKGGQAVRKVRAGYDQVQRGFGRAVSTFKKQTGLSSNHDGRAVQAGAHALALIASTVNGDSQSQHLRDLMKAGKGCSDTTLRITLYSKIAETIAGIAVRSLGDAAAAQSVFRSEHMEIGRAVGEGFPKAMHETGSSQKGWTVPDEHKVSVTKIVSWLKVAECIDQLQIACRVCALMELHIYDICFQSLAGSMRNKREQVKEARYMMERYKIAPFFQQREVGWEMENIMSTIYSPTAIKMVGSIPLLGDLAKDNADARVFWGLQLMEVFHRCALITHERQGLSFTVTCTAVLGGFVERIQTIAEGYRVIASNIQSEHRSAMKNKVVFIPRVDRLLLAANMSIHAAFSHQTPHLRVTLDTATRAYNERPFRIILESAPQAVNKITASNKREEDRMVEWVDKEREVRDAPYSQPTSLLDMVTRLGNMFDAFSRRGARLPPRTEIDVTDQFMPTAPPAVGPGTLGFGEHVFSPPPTRRPPPPRGEDDVLEIDGDEYVPASDGEVDEDDDDDTPVPIAPPVGVKLDPINEWFLLKKTISSPITHDDALSQIRDWLEEAFIFASFFMQKHVLQGDGITDYAKLAVSTIWVQRRAYTKQYTVKSWWQYKHKIAGLEFLDTLCMFRFTQHDTINGRPEPRITSTHICDILRRMFAVKYRVSGWQYMFNDSKRKSKVNSLKTFTGALNEHEIGKIKHVAQLLVDGLRAHENDAKITKLYKNKPYVVVRRLLHSLVAFLTNQHIRGTETSNCDIRYGSITGYNPPYEYGFKHELARTFLPALITAVFSPPYDAKEASVFDQTLQFNLVDMTVGGRVYGVYDLTVTDNENDPKKGSPITTVWKRPHAPFHRDYTPPKETLDVYSDIGGGSGDFDDMGDM